MPVKRDVHLNNTLITIANTGGRNYIYNITFVKILKKKNPVAIIDTKVILHSIGTHFGFPGICRLPNNGLLVVAREGKFHAALGDFGKIVGVHSTDRGVSWNTPVTVISLPAADLRDPAATRLSNGRVVVTFACSGKTCGHSGQAVHSDDEGRSWSSPVPTMEVFSPNGITEQNDTLFYLGMRQRADSSFNEIVRSTDHGETWSRYSEVAGSKAYGEHMTWVFYDEPSLAILPGGKWISHFRVDADNAIRQSHSTSYGSTGTWSVPLRTGIGVTPSSLLFVNDTMLISSGAVRKDRYGIRITVSTDGGVSWDDNSTAVIAETDGPADLGYTKTIALDNQEFYSVFYMQNRNNNGSSIFGVRWKFNRS
ncbi:MAG: sialidase family protein, partial [Bacteroidota bacterium]